MKIEHIGKTLLVECLGEEDRAVRILAVGDLHLGYEEVLNRSGVFVTRQMFNEMIEYFDRVFDYIGKTGRVDKVVLLGDVKHNFGGILKQEWNDVLRLFDYLEGKLGRTGEIIIVKGNHDNILEPIVRKRDKVKLDDYYICDDVAFVHGDKDYDGINDEGVKTWVMGHGHPAVKLKEGVKVEKFKCFLTGKFRGKEIVIVPSFFEYSGGSDPRENDFKMGWNFDLDKFEVKIVGEDLEVLDFGKLGELE